MKTRLLRKLLATVLSLITLFALTASVFQTAYADGETEKDYIDYVLILDCTTRTVDVDNSEIRAAAAKMFVDLIPVDNARIAVFKIGANDPNAENRTSSGAKSYKLLADDKHMADALYRMRCIYQLWDFNQLISDTTQRDDLKKLIDKAYSTQQGSYHDTHCAVYAALDTLKHYDSKNACIMLVSEEFTAFYEKHKVLTETGREVESDHTLWKDIKETLESNRNWVFNWINLGKGEGHRKEEFDEICRINRGRLDHDVSIAKLPETIATIVSQYTGSKEEEGHLDKLDDNGYAEIRLPDFLMLTEANIVVTGDGIERVTITDPEGVEISESTESSWISTNYDPNNKSRFLYSAIKLIRPLGGGWTINVKGAAGGQVYVQTIRTIEPDIKLACNYETNAEGVIGVGTTLHFVATYQYAGQNLRCGSKAYESYQKGARLYYTHSSNPAKEIDISDKLKVEGEQYVCDFVVEKHGTYNFYFSVTSGEFKSGERYAEPKNITVDNHKPKANGTIEDLIDIHVGSSLEAIRNIQEHFSDEDTEPLTLQIKCLKEGREIGEENRFWELTEDGFLSIHVPEDYQGEYVFKASATDTNGAESEVISFSLRTINDPPQLKTAQGKPIIMIAKAPDLLVSLGMLPKDQSRDFVIRAEDVFEDPENRKMVFTSTPYNHNEDGIEIITARFGEEDNTWIVTANHKGSASVTITATDSCGETVSTVFEFNVKTVGAVLAERYWWVPVLIVIIILIILALLASRRVRGSWNITVEDKENRSACSHSFTSLPSSRDQKLKKTKVSLLSIVKCAVRKEDCMGDVQTTPLKDKVIVFKGALTLGKGVKFIYTPVSRITVSLNDTVLTKSGKYILKKDQVLNADCKDADDSLVLNVQATFH